MELTVVLPLGGQDADFVIIRPTVNQFIFNEIFVSDCKYFRLWELEYFN